MGLLKAGVGAAGGVLADQWREYFYCEALDADTLVAKGEKRVGKRGSNTKGENNVISDGSIVAVADGQCMMIVENGAVVDVCAEPGEFVYDTGTEPSVFSGKLGDMVKKSFEQVGRRFTFGGDAGKDQRIYYFNTKEIVGNKYGTASPVPFRVVDEKIGLDVDITVRCNGEYSYKLVDPLMFYKNVCGNVESAYTRDLIDSQLKSELLTALQPAFARISEMGIRYSAVPAHTRELADALNEELSHEWKERRGIEIAAFGVNTISAPEDQEQMIRDLQKAAVMANPAMAAANIASAQSDAMRTAAANPAGAAMGFMGMGMASGMGGMNAAQLFGQASQAQQAPAQASQAQQAPAQTQPAGAAGGVAAGTGTAAAGAA
ncbi:SPFH domain-containing protein [Bifidobacterium dentium]|uniref:SPFH domain-containing protein n=1 Tax=Bifidobacterium dentium TaxID=1689 RepID=UPI000A8B1058|nr:SPFH domain-containing protein [Bifidobacterium dentium]